MVSESEAARCPGLFDPTTAQDGILARLRVPGGRLSVAQCHAIADIADRLGNGTVQITNRANIQLRGLQAPPSNNELAVLQQLGLAAATVALDAMRNIMTSPTAGIDAQALLDTRPLVLAWQQHLKTHAPFTGLSPKFSVCFDGGEAVYVGDRPNDITLVAAAVDGQVRLRLHLSMGQRGDLPQDTGAWVEPQHAIPLLVALTEVYSLYSQQQSPNPSPPRLRKLLQEWGLATYLEAVETRVPGLLQQTPVAWSRPPVVPDAHLGVHAQKQPGQCYLGIALPLGQVQTLQLRTIAALAAEYGNDELRLTPWQTLLLPHIAQAAVPKVIQQIQALGLAYAPNAPSSSIVACSGTTGCRSAVANTQQHGLALIAHLERCIELDTLLNIHLSGCKKSCAQHHSQGITLVAEANGQDMQQPLEEAYRVYVGSEGSPFGKQLYARCPAAQVPILVEAMLRTYHLQRHNAAESFAAFANRQEMAELRQGVDAILGQE